MEPTEHTTRNIPHWPELVSLAGAFLLVLLIAILSYQGWRAYGRHSEELATSQEVVTNINGLLSSLKDAETGQRGFLLTGKDRYLEPYRRNLTNVSTNLNALAMIAVRRPELAQRLERLKPRVREKLMNCSRRSSFARRRGPTRPWPLS